MVVVLYLITNISGMDICLITREETIMGISRGPTPVWCDRHFMRSKSKGNSYAHKSKWDKTCIFHGDNSCFYFPDGFHPTCCSWSRLYSRNIQVISTGSKFHRNCYTGDTWIVYFCCVGALDKISEVAASNNEAIKYKVMQWYGTLSLAKLAKSTSLVPLTTAIVVSVITAPSGGATRLGLLGILQLFSVDTTRIDDNAGTTFVNPLVDVNPIWMQVPISSVYPRV